MTTTRRQRAPCEDLAQRVQSRLVEFVRLTRGNDFPVGVAEEVDAQRVALACGADDLELLRWGWRGLLCSDRADWERFDALFDAYWMPGNASSRVQAPPAGKGRNLENRSGGDHGEIGLLDQTGAGDDVDTGKEGARGGASAHELLEHTDFGTLTDANQMRTMGRLVEALARRRRRLLIRRQQVRLKGRRLHLRHTVRASLSFGGIPLHLKFRQRRRRQPRLIIITDMSRYMAMYSYLFLRFARGLVNAFKDADAFACHTRLVRITDALRQADTGKAAQSLTLISQGWSGGTRLGASLANFNQRYGRLLSQRSIVVVSDGLDTGEPQTLAQELARMRRRCRRIVWLNPLLGRDGYEVRTQGMLAALPHLDLFAPAHNLRSLAALEPALAAI